MTNCATEAAGGYNRGKELANRPLIQSQAFGEALDPHRLDKLARYEIHLDRKLERINGELTTKSGGLIRLEVFGTSPGEFDRIVATNKILFEEGAACLGVLIS